MYLQINTVKYDTDGEIANTYENLQIVPSQFFTDKLIFIYIRYNLNIYWDSTSPINGEWVFSPSPIFGKF